MSKVDVYGVSDDLIETEGDICEEFNPKYEETSYLAFSDGSVLSIEYGKTGLWTIRQRVAGSATYSKRDATDVDHDYSDRVTLEGDISWLVFGSRFEPVREPPS